jgi:hypothetical protein
VNGRAPAPSNGERHPLTLRFIDPELERAFSEERGAALGRGLQRAVFFAGILWAVGGVILVGLSPAT